MEIKKKGIENQRKSMKKQWEMMGNQWGIDDKQHLKRRANRTSNPGQPKTFNFLAVCWIFFFCFECLFGF